MIGTNWPPGWWAEMSSHGCKASSTHLYKWLLRKRRVDDTVDSIRELLFCLLSVTAGTQMVLSPAGASLVAASSPHHWQCLGDGFCPRKDGSNWPNLFSCLGYFWGA